MDVLAIGIGFALTEALKQTGERIIVIFLARREVRIVTADPKRIVHLRGSLGHWLTRSRLSEIII